MTSRRPECPPRPVGLPADELTVQPPHLLKICRAEKCQAMGCDDLIRHIEGRLGIKLNQTTPDGAITFEHIFCLGLCRTPPALMLDGELYRSVTSEIVDALIDTVRNPVE